MKFTYHGPAHAATIEGSPEKDGARKPLFEGWLTTGVEIDLPESHQVVRAWLHRGWLRPLEARPASPTKRGGDAPASTNV